MRNLAFLSSQQKSILADFADASAILGRSRIHLLLSDARAIAQAEKSWPRLDPSLEIVGRDFASMGFHRVPISFGDIHRRLLEWLQESGSEPLVRTLLVVDMSWGLDTNSAAANFGGWLGVVDALTESLPIAVVSLYNRRLLIDEQLLTALRGHQGFLTSSGLVANPHWLPAHLLTRGTLRQQIDFWLSGVSPELAESLAPESVHAAEGTDPMWLLRRAAEEPSPVLGGAEAVTGERWKVRCFGRLRIYRNDGSQVAWDVPGGATRKTKALFAYLLQKGGQGADADDLADFLWPEAETPGAGRNRLHHTIRCLRQALDGGRAGDNGSTSVLRDGSRYVLAPPDKSWLDISTFEQLCRQARTHINTGAKDEALICLLAADRLYTGDLFEDIPAEYADDSERDWCWSKRYWLREMYFNVQRDAARIHRERQDFSAALGHCQKALAIDPLCEPAHEEAMRVFAAQGRREAVDRQFALYVGALGRSADRPRSAALRRTYEGLSAKAEFSK